MIMPRPDLQSRQRDHVTFAKSVAIFTFNRKQLTFGNLIAIFISSLLKDEFPNPISYLFYKKIAMLFINEKVTIKIRARRNDNVRRSYLKPSRSEVLPLL